MAVDLVLGGGGECEIKLTKKKYRNSFFIACVSRAVRATFREKD